MQRKAGILILCTAFLALAKPSMGLSWELCDSYGSEWVTGSPHLEGKFPFYSLIFSCTGEAGLTCEMLCLIVPALHVSSFGSSSCPGVQTSIVGPQGQFVLETPCVKMLPSLNSTACVGGLNIEGKQVDACINNGRDCGLPAAEAFCKYIGFDGATPDMQQTAPADEPVRAVSGIISCCVSSRPESICSQCLDPLGLARCIFTLLLYWHARHTGAPENSLLGCCSQQGLPGISNNILRWDCVVTFALHMCRRVVCVPGQLPEPGRPEPDTVRRPRNSERQQPALQPPHLCNMLPESGEHGQGVHAAAGQCNKGCSPNACAGEKANLCHLQPAWDCVRYLLLMDCRYGSREQALTYMLHSA